MSDMTRYITVLVEPSQVFSGYFFARAATSFRGVSGNIYNVSGAAFGMDDKIVYQKALSEVLEHFYAHCAVAPVNKLPRFFTLSGLSIESPYNWTDICIGNGIIDASGLACHNSIAKSVQHGLNELLERHLLVQWWYKDFTLVPIINKEPSIIDCYSIAMYGDLPFAVAILSDIERDIFICGSGFRETISDAVRQAKSEAMMLYEVMIRNNKKNWIAHNEAATSRAYSLQSSLSVLRAAHFHSKLEQKKPIVLNKTKLTLDDVLRKLNLSVSDISFCLLHSNKKFAVTRTIAPLLDSVRQCRDMYIDFIPDPFC